MSNHSKENWFESCISRYRHLQTQNTIPDTWYNEAYHTLTSQCQTLLATAALLDGQSLAPTQDFAEALSTIQWYVAVANQLSKLQDSDQVYDFADTCLDLVEQTFERLLPLLQRVPDYKGSMNEAFQRFLTEFKHFLQEAEDPIGADLMTLEERFEQRWVEFNQHASFPIEDKDSAEIEAPLAGNAFRRFMQSEPSQQVRQQVQEAFNHACSSRFPTFDNSETAIDILRLRQQQANAHGAAHYAEAQNRYRSLNWSQARDLLKQVAQASNSKLRFAATDSRQDMPATMCDYFHQMPPQEMDRLPLDCHLDILVKRLLQFFCRMLNMELTSFETIGAMWLAQISGDHTRLLLSIDYQPNPAKAGAAWTELLSSDTLVRPNQPRHTHAEIVMQIERPEQGITFTELQTLCHELGHGFEMALYRDSYGEVPFQMRKPRDLIELCSMLAENLVRQRGFLALLLDSPDTLDQAQLVSLTRPQHNEIREWARTLESAIFDLDIHSQVSVPDTVVQLESIYQQALAEVGMFQAEKHNQRFLTFVHVFSEQYASFQYGYLWSNLLAMTILRDLQLGERFQQGIPAGALSGAFNSDSQAEWVERLISDGLDIPSLIAVWFEGALTAPQPICDQ